MTCGKEKVGRNFPLESSGSFRWGEGKKEETKKKEEEKMSEKLHLLSRIYRDQVVGFHRSKRQSSSTRQELRVGTRIESFRQTPKGMGCSHTLVLFGIRAI